MDLNSIYDTAEKVGYPITDDEADEILEIVYSGQTVEQAVEEHARQWFEAQEGEYIRAVA